MVVSVLVSTVAVSSTVSVFTTSGAGVLQAARSAEEIIRNEIFLNIFEGLFVIK